MGINAEPFWIPKAGCTEAEYEDAFYPEGALLTGVHKPFQEGPVRFAIADGATDSSYSGMWARLLVRSFVEAGHATHDIESILAESRPKWLEHIGERQLPWYAEERVHAGAFSSLLGLTISEPDSAGISHWSALAIGDSCLVQVRGETAAVRFPITHSSLFDSGPFLLASNERSDAEIGENTATIEGLALADDAFYLMTDALACWFMRQDEEGRAPWRVLRDLNTSDQRESFPDFVTRLRSERAIRNDDCTLIRIDIC